MIKKTITYENYNGEKVTKDFYFHLSKVDGLELSIDGSFEGRMRKAIQEQDKLTVFREFKKLISAAIGVRSENGEEFSKPEAYRDSFMNSPAFDELIMEIFQSEDKAAEFMRALFPSGMQAAMKTEMDAAVAKGDVITVDPFQEQPAWIRENREPTEVEVRTMTREQLMDVTRRRLQAKNS